MGKGRDESCELRGKILSQGRARDHPQEIWVIAELATGETIVTPARRCHSQKTTTCPGFIAAGLAGLGCSRLARSGRACHSAKQASGTIRRVFPWKMSTGKNRSKLISWMLGIGMRVFTKEELRTAWLKLEEPTLKLTGKMQYLAYTSLLIADRTGVSQPLISALRKRSLTEISIYDELYLDAKLNRIFDMPKVVVDATRPRTINILVPAFDFNSISAGFFGVFQTALFIKKSTPHNVRLVLFDNFFFDLEKARAKIKGYPGMEQLFDDMEVDYIGERKQPLLVSSEDNCVATVWYSAYFAAKIMGTIGSSRPFLYLIQDYESSFYPGSSSSVVANESYKFNFSAFFSSESLRNFFVSNDIGGIRSRGLPVIHFNNACAANLMGREEFFRVHGQKEKKRLVFYSRPVVDRNMFELTAKAILAAFKEGIFNHSEWDCIGMGLGECTLKFDDENQSVCMPRMNLTEYIQSVASFDICLTLMASPHPSLIPMDLAGSGAVVVTNTYATKTNEYLQSLCTNIIAAEPTLPALVSALKHAKEVCMDLEERYQAATNMNYPRSWNDTFSAEHRDFVNSYL